MEGGGRNYPQNVGHISLASFPPLIEYVTSIYLIFLIIYKQQRISHFVPLERLHVLFDSPALFFFLNEAARFFCFSFTGAQCVEQPMRWERAV